MLADKVADLDLETPFLYPCAQKGHNSRACGGGEAKRNPGQSMVVLGHRNLSFTAQTGSVQESRIHLHTCTGARAHLCAP